MEEAYQNVSIPINAALLSASGDKIYTTDNPPPVFSSCMFLMWALISTDLFFLHMSQYFNQASSIMREKIKKKKIFVSCAFQPIPEEALKINLRTIKV